MSKKSGFHRQNWPKSVTHLHGITQNSVHNYLNDDKTLRSSIDDWFRIGFTYYLYPRVFYFNLVLIHSWHKDMPYLRSGVERVILYGLHKHELLLVGGIVCIKKY